VALRASDGDFNSLLGPGCLTEGNRGESIILCLLARLTSLRLVFQAFVVKENLFADCPDEIIATVDTGDGAVLIIRCPIPLCLFTSFL
jgi:hypothetical protein